MDPNNVDREPKNMAKQVTDALGVPADALMPWPRKPMAGKGHIGTKGKASGKPAGKLGRGHRAPRGVNFKKWAGLD